MADSQTPESSALAAASRPVREGLTRGEIAGGVASAVWILVMGLAALTQPAPEAGSGAIRFVLLLMAVFMPVVLAWVTVAAVRASLTMRAEGRRLQAAIDALRNSYIEERQTSGARSGYRAPAAPRPEPQVESAPETPDPEPQPGPAQQEAGPAAFSSSRRASAPPEDQPALAFAPLPEDTAPKLGTMDFLRALNFPDSEADTAGIAALKRALKDPSVRQLVQASQDVLTLLSQDGIYMDDLEPDLARPEVWRRFAKGERGRAVSVLGGVHDREALDLATQRMREDTIFRDAAHYFLRRFDQSLEGFEETASDEEMVALSDTRTGRAFMLLGRVTGIFD